MIYNFVPYVSNFSVKFEALSVSSLDQIAQDTVKHQQKQDKYESEIAELRRKLTGCENRLEKCGVCYGSQDKIFNIIYII